MFDFHTAHAAVDLPLLPPVTSPLFALPRELVVRVRSPLLSPDSRAVLPHILQLWAFPSELVASCR